MTEERIQRESGYEGLPEYVGGTYLDRDRSRPCNDSGFKTQQFLALFGPLAAKQGWSIRTFADVGCGRGAETRALMDGLRKLGHPVSEAWGYDVHPELDSLPSRTDLHFVRGDFTQTKQMVDLVLLFDVFEHVPDPTGFLRAVGDRCRCLALHIPLDNNLNHSARNLYQSKLLDPGHLVFLDVCQALTLMSLAGLRVLRYAYTPGFRVPSGARSALARLARVPRTVIWWLNPWLLSKTLGGCSLLVLAETPMGWSNAR